MATSSVVEPVLRSRRHAVVGPTGGPGFGACFSRVGKMSTRGNSVWPQRRRSRGSESGVPDMRHEVEVNQVVVGVPWLWCIAGCLAWWVLVAWAVERLV